ncbi:MAG: tRNA pseudouridine(55) synthase TruB [Propionibacteriaceae bacterium]|nr:tRNA pseudouridine(55) synthase TruB [Propionibacteriaceae bacterium]
MNATASGVIVVDKPAGWTSHQVVGRVRRLVGTRKVGHAGTLDPMATGVLILGVNRATRLLGHLALHDKRYLATIRLGQATTTDDAEGEVVAQADASHVTEEQVRAQLARLTGNIMQRPSSVSAIKVGGKRAYARVRAGEQVDLPARAVTVTRFDLLTLGPAPAHGGGESPLADAGGEAPHGGLVDLDVDVECSSGTYVRALARDLGAALGVGGHLTMLRRTRIGRYPLDLAQPIDQEAPPLMTMADAARLSFPCVEVSASQATEIGYGRALPLPVPADPTGMIGPDGDLLALYRPDGEGSRPVAVLV